MRRYLAIFLSVAGLVGMAAMATAEENHTPEQAKALVQKAVEYLKREGKEKALAVFSDPKGEFVDGDLYLIVFDAVDGKLTMLAHGVNKALIGKPSIDVRDANGIQSGDFGRFGNGGRLLGNLRLGQSGYQENSPKEKLLYQSW
jgi:cytochrome c